jgi:hypothetical protein
VQPPLPVDWEVRPTYPVHNVPYALASLWDTKCAEEERKPRKARDHGSAKTTNKGRVPKELKQHLKRSRCAKGLLHDLEKVVREFLQAWDVAVENNRKQLPQSDPAFDDEEEYVLVPNGQNHSRNSSLDLVHITQPEKLVFSSALNENPSAPFM